MHNLDMRIEYQAYIIHVTDDFDPHGGIHTHAHAELSNGHQPYSPRRYSHSTFHLLCYIVVCIFTPVRTLYAMFFIFFFCINKINCWCWWARMLHLIENTKKKRENENDGKNKCISSQFLQEIKRRGNKKCKLNCVFLLVVGMPMSIWKCIYEFISKCAASSSWIGIYWILSWKNQIKMIIEKFRLACLLCVRVCVWSWCGLFYL